MTITDEELERLVKRSDSPKDYVRYDARDKLDAMAVDMARELLAARKAVELIRTIVDDWTLIPDPEAPSKRIMVPTLRATRAKAILTAYDQARNPSEGE